MTLPKETRDRIFAVADALYEQAGRATFPTVDAVRKTARVNMNDASTGMKEWRRAQTAQATPLVVQIPEPVQQANLTALAALWEEAQTVANESLRAVQAGWEAERIEAETLNKQMADAYETQAAELEAAQVKLAELEEAAKKSALSDAEQRKLVEDLHVKLTSAQQQAAAAEARANELRIELDHCHKETQQLRIDRDHVQEKFSACVEQMQTLRTELTKVQVKAEADQQAHQEHRKTAAVEVQRQADRLAAAKTERDNARKDAAQAKEDAATLRGKLQALEQLIGHTAKKPVAAQQKK